MTSGQVVGSSLGSPGGCPMGKGGQELQLEFLGGVQLWGRENNDSWQAYPSIRTDILTAKSLNLCQT